MLKNTTNIPVSLAVWLATDFYNYDPRPNYLSATTLLKPIKEIILSRTLPMVDDADICNNIASGIGTAIHRTIEEVWAKQSKKGLARLGYPKSTIGRIIINPPDISKLDKDDIPVYLERQAEKVMGKWIVGGTFDFVIEDKLTDFKSTSVYTWIFGSNDEKYSQQGSIYRWLNPEIIKKDQMDIAYIFTDWSAAASKQKSDYPKSKILSKTLDLMSLANTERFITLKLNEIEKYEASDQANLPLCTSKDLWEKPAVFKYYKNPAKKSRSTKNFDNMVEALNRKSADGNIGEVVEVKGEKVYCKYCSVINGCDQAKQYIMDGSLKM